MEKIVKITNENYPEIYNDKYEKYFLVNNNKDIIGIATVDENAKTNKIKINILDEYRGNGYGKYIFGEVLQDYKARHNEKELRFEVNDKNRFNDILYQFGSINIANNNGTLVYILPIR